MKIFWKVVLWIFFPLVMVGVLVYSKTKEKQGKGKAALFGVCSSIMAMFVLIIGMVMYGTNPAVQEDTKAYNQQQAEDKATQEEAQRTVAISLIRNVDIFQKQEKEVLSSGDVVAAYDFYKNWEKSWLNTDTTGWNDNLETVQTWAWSYCEQAQKYLESNSVKDASDLKDKKGYFDNACYKAIGDFNITPEELGASK